ncbi:MAG: hypothetical protein II888_06480 [Clostridia bacterium]|nr:hypothetical protein [Clostridia bacterium]
MKLQIRDDYTLPGRKRKVLLMFRETLCEKTLPPKGRECRKRVNQLARGGFPPGRERIALRKITDGIILWAGWSP